MLADAPLAASRGVSWATLQLLQRLMDMGHQVDVIAARHVLGGRVNWPWWRCQQAWAGWRLGWQATHFPALRQVDLLHSVDGTLITTCLCSRALRLPFVHAMFSAEESAESASGPSDSAASTWEAWAIRQTAGVVVFSQSLEDRIAAYTRDLPVIRSEWIYQQAAQPGPCAPEKNRLCPTGERMAIYVGDLGRDYHLLLDAFWYAHHKMPQLRLLAIGGSDRDVRRAIHHAKALGIQERIEFQSCMAEEILQSYLRQADVLIAPAAYGRHPPVELHAYLVSQRPIVATNIPGHTELLSQQSACLVKPTALDVAAGVQHVMAHYDVYRQRALQTAQRAMAQTRNDMRGTKLTTFYEDVEERVRRPTAT